MNWEIWLDDGNPPITLDDKHLEEFIKELEKAGYRVEGYTDEYQFYLKNKHAGRAVPAKE